MANKKVLFLILAAVLILPLSAYADCPVCVTIITSVVNTALYIASAVVVVLWLVAGILFLSAQGDPSKFTKARGALIAAVAGTVLVIVAASALTLVGQAIGVQ